MGRWGLVKLCTTLVQTYWYCVGAVHAVHLPLLLSTTPAGWWMATAGKRIEQLHWLVKFLGIYTIIFTSVSLKYKVNKLMKECHHVNFLFTIQNEPVCIRPVPSSGRWTGFPLSPWWASSASPLSSSITLWWPATSTSAPSPSLFWNWSRERPPCSPSGPGHPPSPGPLQRSTPPGWPSR